MDIFRRDVLSAMAAAAVPTLWACTIGPSGHVENQRTLSPRQHAGRVGKMVRGDVPHRCQPQLHRREQAGGGRDHRGFGSISVKAGWIGGAVDDGRAHHRCRAHEEAAIRSAGGIHASDEGVRRRGPCLADPSQLPVHKRSGCS